MYCYYTGNGWALLVSFPNLHVQIGSARSVINERRRELEAAARSSIRDEENRNAVFELACFTPQTILAYGCKAGARVCLLLADGRPARLPSGALLALHLFCLLVEQQMSLPRHLSISPRRDTIINRPRCVNRCCSLQRGRGIRPVPSVDTQDG